MKYVFSRPECIGVGHAAPRFRPENLTGNVDWLCTDAECAKSAFNATQNFLSERTLRGQAIAADDVCFVDYIGRISWIWRPKKHLGRMLTVDCFQ